MLQLVHYLTGYLTINVFGFSPERFMNLCRMNGIYLWNIIVQENRYSMNLSLKDFYRIRKLRSKSRVKVVISKRYGLPFLLQKQKEKTAFLLSLILCLCLFLLSSQFVWEIDYVGFTQQEASANDILLEKNHIHTWMSKRKLVYDEIERIIRDNYPEVIWTSAGLYGNRLIISVKKSDIQISQKSSNQADMTEQRNLYAPFEGKIVALTLRKGTGMAQRGDSVEKGDLLVEGLVLVSNDDGTIKEELPCQADADVLLEHEINKKITISTHFQKKEYTGKRKNYYPIKLWNKVLFMPAQEPFKVFDEKKEKISIPLLNKIQLPITCYKITYDEYVPISGTFSEQEANDILQRKISIFLSRLEEKGIQIMSKDVKIDCDADNCTAQLRLVVQEWVCNSFEE